VWNGAEGTIKWLFDGHTNGVTALAFSKDSKCLASGAGDSSARVYGLSAGKEVGRVRFPGPSTYVNSVDICADGSLLLAAIDGYAGIYKMPK
jgi:WD40 repeat protein